MHGFFHEAARHAISDALRKLLSEKHLYQSVAVDTEFIELVIPKIIEHECHGGPSLLSGRVLPSAESVRPQCLRDLESYWIPKPLDETGISFELPTIHCYCANSSCKDRWPFNPIPEETSWAGDRPTESAWYLLLYQCQSCKGIPIRFLVRREGNKLRLSGRDPIEVYPTPKFLPSPSSKYFGDAQIAHHAGQTLAGLFLLRVFIEQFWNTFPAVRKLAKAEKAKSGNFWLTGDMMGDAYNSTLPDDFKMRFPSLSDVYGKLSVAIHTADANADLFEESCDKIIKHFDARRMFQL